METIENDEDVPLVVFICRGCNDEKQLMTCISRCAVGMKREREKRKIEFGTQLKITRGVCGICLFFVIVLIYLSFNMHGVYIGSA